MIRATFLLILALTLATGESAMLICQAVCVRGNDADGDACRHAQSAAPVSMTNDADCLGVALPAMATARVELTRPDPHGATAVALSTERLMTSFGRPFAPTSFTVCIGGPPRIVSLRI